MQRLLTQALSLSLANHIPLWRTRSQTLVWLVTLIIQTGTVSQWRLDPYGDDILGWIEETPDMTLDELSARLRDIHQARAPKSTIDDWLRSRNISFKKNRTRQ